MTTRRDPNLANDYSMTAPIRRAVTYCRISADMDGIGAGVDRQQVDTDKLCETRGSRIVERLVDNDRSASRYARRSREDWTRLLHLLDTNAVDEVVAYDLDRLTRRPDELAPLIAAAERGVLILTVSGSMLDLSTADGVFAARILLAVAEKETANASRRQKDKLRHDAMNGRPHWPRRPFGFQFDGTVIPLEAAWVNAMIGWIADDGLSATEVARRLNEAGVTLSSGLPWKSASVKSVVTAPRNVGLRVHQGAVIGKGNWSPIVDEKDWRNACSALSLRSLGTPGGRRSMLTGMVRCGGCGQTMVRTQNARKVAVFCCKLHADTGTGCNRSIKAEPVEQLISEAVMVRLGEVRAAKRSAARVEMPNLVETLRAEMADLAEMAGSGQLTMAEWKAVRGPLMTRLQAAEADEARRDVGAALIRIAGDNAKLIGHWEKLDVDLQRRLISLVLDHVTIKPGQRGSFDLGRAVPTWRVA